jgi:hypothetical protein
MPQYPLVPVPGGTATTLDITTATVIKSSPGRVYTISVVSGSGSTAGAVYDSTSTSGNTAANSLGEIPAALTTAPINFNAMPTATGIVVVPPTGYTVAVSWS